MKQKSTQKLNIRCRLYIHNTFNTNNIPTFKIRKKRIFKVKIQPLWTLYICDVQYILRRDL